MAMMKAAEIRDMRARWEAETRAAVAENNDAFYSYRVAGIAALDLVLGDNIESIRNRIPWSQKENN
jgi:hypothetical protein